MVQIHILDGQEDTILDYVTEKNIISDNHKKSLEDTLESYDFIAFADRRYTKHLEKRNRIIIPDEDTEQLREFVIQEVAIYKDSEGYKVQTIADCSYLELKKAAIIYPDSFKGNAGQHVGRALNNTDWSVGRIEGKGSHTISNDKHTNPYEMLRRIAKDFELELNFRIEHNGNRVIGRYVDLLEQKGEWRGREVVFGRDLDSIRRVEKQDIVTALLGLGPEDEDGKRIEVLVEDDDALKRWGRVDQFGELQHLIEPYEIESEREDMTEEEARQYTRTALNKRIDTQVTYETTIIDLEHVPGMENKKIRHGDTIRIKDEYFDPPLYLEARIFEQNGSIKTKAKRDIKLGAYREFTEEEINAIWLMLQKEIRKKIDVDMLREYAEPRKVESDEPPEIKEEENPIWVDTSQKPNVAHVVNAGEWVKMTPTTPEEVDAYNKKEVEDKAKEAADALEIGNSNLLLNTDFSQEFEHWDMTDGDHVTYKIQNVTTDFRPIMTSSGKEFRIEKEEGEVTVSQDIVNMIPSDTEDITVSFYVYQSNSAKGYIRVYLQINDGEFIGTDVQLPDKKGELFRFVHTYDISDKNIKNLRVTTDLKDFEGVCWLQGYSTTLGNKVTGWNKAGKDIEERAEQARRDAEAFAKNAENITEGVFDVGAVPLRTSITGARLEWDGANGLVQYNRDGDPTNWLNLEGEFHATNGYFSGELEGATGTFGGEIRARDLVVENPNVETDGYSTIKLQLAQDTQGGSKPFKKMGYVEFLSQFGGLEVRRENEKGNNVPLDNFLLNAKQIELLGNIHVGSGGTGGSDYGISFPDYHSMGASGTQNAFAIWGNRASDSRPFLVRSHSNETSYRNDMYIAANGNFRVPGITNNTTTAAANVNVTDGGWLRMKTSSRKYKLLEEPVKVDPYNILKIEPKDWFDKNQAETLAKVMDCEYKGKEVERDIEVTGVKRIAGLVAEDVKDADLDIYVDYDENGEVQGTQYERLWTLLIPIVRDLKNELEELKNERSNM